MAGRKKKSKLETQHEQEVKLIFSRQFTKVCQKTFFDGRDKEITYKELFRIHEYLNPEDAALCLNDIDRNSAVRKMRQWLNGGAIPDYYTLGRLCDENCLNCSFDYLFGRIECTKHDIQFIHDQTGLSETAIKKLHHLSSFPAGKATVQIIDYFIRHGDSMFESIKRIYAYKLNYDKCEDIYKNERPPLTNDSIYEDEAITKKRNLIDKQYSDAKTMCEVAPARAIGRFETLIKKMIDYFYTNGWR